MKYRLTCCLFLTLLFTSVALAQGGKPSGGRGGTTSSTRSPGVMQPTMNAPDPGLEQRAFLSGTVVLDDGSALTESATIQTFCQGRRQTVAHTDSHGNFSFEFGSRTSPNADFSGADADSMGGTVGGRGTRRDWHDCQLLAQLPGFFSQPVDLSSRISNFESADIGRLVLHRMGRVEGLTISATSAMAPRDARKAYEKGRDKANKQKWDEAQPLLAKAVEMYPRYAVAWFDLGRVQMQKSDAVEARHSFEQSISADPKYVNPYRGLAELEMQQQRWQPLVSVTAQLLALDPVSFPDAWLRNALGNYFLHNFAEAEKSARQGMKIDEQGQLPRLEYLLGLILSQEHAYPEAATHIQNYIKVATQPAEKEDAQKQLNEITRLSAAVNGAADSEKK